MSENNMAVWDTLKSPPPDALTPIRAGRLKGKSDINPQWRYEALTQEFGPCGRDWWVEIVRLWSEPGGNDEVMAMAHVNLHIDGWEHPIPGIGGSMLVEEEKKGMHTSDEGYKMAVTDAIGTAAKLIGLAADVYRGRHDDSKYSKNPVQQKSQSEEEDLF
jgi:hypothetical protein